MERNNQHLDFSFQYEPLPVWAAANGMGLRYPIPQNFTEVLAQEIGVNSEHKLLGLCAILCQEFGATRIDFAVLMELINAELAVDICCIDVGVVDRMLASATIGQANDEVARRWEAERVKVCEFIAVNFDRYLTAKHRPEWEHRVMLMQYCILIIEAAWQASRQRHRRCNSQEEKCDSKK